MDALHLTLARQKADETTQPGDALDLPARLHGLACRAAGQLTKVEWEATTG